MKRILSWFFPDRPEARPEEAFDRVIADKRARYAELKQAVAKVLFLRNKLEGDLLERRAKVARIHDEARRAARRNDDRRALSLISRMNDAKARLRSAEEELAEVRAQSRAVKRDLEAVRESIDALEREKVQSAAKLKGAAAKRALAKILSEEQRAGDDQRLEEVRRLVAKTSAEAALDRELGGDDLELELADASARIELARLKSRLLPA